MESERGRGGIGFMSTQKRASRSSPATRMCRPRGDCRGHQESIHRAGATGSVSPALLARKLGAGSGGATAPYLSIVWSIWFWMATNFLLEDKPLRLPVRPALEAERPGSPPFRSPVFGLPASPGHPAIPVPPTPASLHPRLPQAPATIRRAERYDGQRNLHFLHAA
jgi:hypothetical protein